MKLYGDFRGRFQQNNADNPAYIERNRYRYRLRVGATISLFDDFDIGFRFASGNPQTNPGGTLVGGAPFAANQDLNSLETRKFLWIDTAYAKWTPIKGDFTLSTTIGKMDNPFMLSNMLFDYDLQPEGGALQAAYNLGEKHVLKSSATFFVLDELNQGNPAGSTLPAGTSIDGTHDPYLYGAQVLLESKWSKQFETTIGLAAFNIDDREALSAKAQPLWNVGNTRDANGFLRYNYNPIIGTAGAIYKFAGAPLYPGEFPVKIAGEFMENPAAPANDEGWRVGFTLGKAGKKGGWEVNYRYQQLQADAWFDALVDDENGAFYAAGHPQLTGTGRANGWFGGTNVKGHQVVATYSFTDFINFTFIYYVSEAIINVPGQKSETSNLIADLNWRL